MFKSKKPNESTGNGDAAQGNTSRPAANKFGSRILSKRKLPLVRYVGKGQLEYSTNCGATWKTADKAAEDNIHFVIKTEGVSKYITRKTEPDYLVSVTRGPEPEKDSYPLNVVVTISLLETKSANVDLQFQGQIKPN